MRGTALSNRQREVLDIIRRHVRSRGVPPSRSELAREMGVKGQATVDQQLNALQRKGWLRLLPGVERGMQLLREGAPLLDPDQLPEVSAGSPVVAEEQTAPPRLHDYESMTALFESPPDYYLTVRGDSMNKVGYEEGDVVAVKRTPEASNGEVVVARIGAEIVLKRYCRKDRDLIELQPESTNSEHEAIHVGPETDDFEIVGVVVGAIVGARRRDECGG